MNPSIKDAAAKMQFGTRPQRNHGLKPNAWTAAECEAVRTHYLNGGATEVLKWVNRSRHAINCQAAKLGVKTNLRAADHWGWSQDQDAALIRHYSAKGAEYVSGLTGRSVLAVRHRAAKLGVRADKSIAAKARYAVQPNKPNPAKRGPKPKGITLRDRNKPRFEPMTGEPKITADTKITIAAPFVDRRWIPDHVAHVVDSEDCRDWARAAARARRA